MGKSSATNTHHLIPRWQIRDLRNHLCPLTGKRLSRHQIKITQFHSGIRILCETHYGFHNIADGLNIIEAYERIYEIFDAMREGRFICPHHTPDMDPKAEWQRTFKAMVEADIAERMLRSWLYYYLFHNSQNPASYKRVYTPDQLLANGTRLFRKIYGGQIAQSPYKRRACVVLIGTGALDKISEEDIRWAYERRLPLE